MFANSNDWFAGNAECYIGMLGVMVKHWTGGGERHLKGVRGS